MAEYTIDMRDVRFLLYEVLGIEKLAEYPPFNDEEMGQGKEMYDMVLDAAYKIAREKISPVNEPGDREGVRLEKDASGRTQVRVPEVYKKAYKAMCDDGWIAPSAPLEWGGMGYPEVLAMATSEMLTGACFAFTMTPGLSIGAANLIKVFGSDEMKNTYLEKMYTGQWGGTMCLTEEAAGSDVGANRAKAVLLDDGTFHIQGTKIFISSGDQDLTENIIHMVLARTENAPKGVKGLSLFLVPKYLVNADGSLGEYNEVRCSKLEEKLGIHGSPTSVLEFGQDDKPCVGYLVGKEQEGIKMMFQMMNEARLYVGLQALSQAGYATEQAILFARERIQGSHFSEFKNPEAPKVAIVLHPDVRRMILMCKAYTEAARSLLYSTAYYTDMAHSAPDEKDRQRYQLLLELMVPVCKAWITDMSFKVTEVAMQVHGGYGYCQEYPVEQMMRDVKITSIYEGTNGIQALDLMGRQVPGKGGLRLMTLLQEMNAWVAENKGNERLGALVGEVDKAKNKLAETAFGLGGALKKNPGATLASAVPFMNMFGDTMGAYHLMKQALIAESKLQGLVAAHGAEDDKAIRKLAKDNPEVRFYWNKIQTAKFFVSNILPNIESYAKAIKTSDSSCMDVVLD